MTACTFHCRYVSYMLCSEASSAIRDQRKTNRPLFESTIDHKPSSAGRCLHIKTQVKSAGSPSNSLQVFTAKK